MSQNGKILVQNIQLVLGLLYHVSISQIGGDHLCKECRHFEHDLILTRDRNKDFHIFQHTTRHSELVFTSGSPTPDWYKNCTCSLFLPRKTKILNQEGLNANQQESLLWSDEPHHPYSSHLNLHSPLHILQKHKPEHCTVNSGQGGGCKVQTTDTEYQLHPLRVASYNIWNVNSLSGEKEGYEGRISRLGKVSRKYTKKIITSVNHSLHLIEGANTNPGGSNLLKSEFLRGGSPIPGREDVKAPPDPPPSQNKPCKKIWI